jgi:hypothetical protein
MLLLLAHAHTFEGTKTADTSEQAARAASRRRRGHDDREAVD